MTPTVRDFLANERTFLAYVRTALAFIAFGFVIARFSLFAREVAVVGHIAVAKTSVSLALGAFMTAVGVALACFGTWRYRAQDHALRRGDGEALGQAASVIIAAGVVACGLVVAFVLFELR
jgi:inner membrane protein YidH